MKPKLLKSVIIIVAFWTFITFILWSLQDPEACLRSLQNVKNFYLKLNIDIPVSTSTKEEGGIMNSWLVQLNVLKYWSLPVILIAVVASIVGGAIAFITYRKFTKSRDSIIDKSEEYRGITVTRGVIPTQKELPYNEMSLEFQQNGDEGIFWNFQFENNPEFIPLIGQILGTYDYAIEEFEKGNSGLPCTAEGVPLADAMETISNEMQFQIDLAVSDAKNFDGDAKKTENNYLSAAHIIVLLMARHLGCIGNCTLSSDDKVAFKMKESVLGAQARNNLSGMLHFENYREKHGVIAESLLIALKYFNDPANIPLSGSTEEDNQSLQQAKILIHRAKTISRKNQANAAPAQPSPATTADIRQQEHQAEPPALPPQAKRERDLPASFEIVNEPVTDVKTEKNNPATEHWKAEETQDISFVEVSSPKTLLQQEHVEPLIAETKTAEDLDFEGLDLNNLDLSVPQPVQPSSGSAGSGWNDVLFNTFLKKMSEMVFQVPGLEKGKKAAAWRVNDRVFIIEGRLKTLLEESLPASVLSAIETKFKGKQSPVTSAILSEFEDRKWLVKTLSVMSDDGSVADVTQSPEEALWIIKAGKLEYKGVLAIDVPENLRYKLPANTAYPITITKTYAQGRVNRGTIPDAALNQLLRN